jgi:hypothetical protein
MQLLPLTEGGAFNSNREISCTCKKNSFLPNFNNKTTVVAQRHCLLFNRIQGFARGRKRPALTFASLSARQKLLLNGRVLIGIVFYYKKIIIFVPL